MANREKMVDLNQQVLNQNNQLKGIMNTAQRTLEIQENTNRALEGQGERIQTAIDMVGDSPNLERHNQGQRKPGEQDDLRDETEEHLHQDRPVRLDPVAVRSNRGEHHRQD